MYRRPVDSTLIRSVGYDLASSVLEVEFQAGRIYEYYDVPLSIYSALMAADSKGTFFNDLIRDLYAYGEVDDLDPPSAAHADDGSTFDAG